MMELEVLEMGVRRLRPTILRSSVLSRCMVWEGWKMALVAEVRKPQPPEPRSQILYKVDVQRAE